MDIHKPKPWHGLREFLKEYLIIVVGVLTALAAEAGVEWLHWRRVRRDRGAQPRRGRRKPRPRPGSWLSTWPAKPPDGRARLARDAARAAPGACMNRVEPVLHHRRPDRVAAAWWRTCRGSAAIRPRSPPAETRRRRAGAGGHAALPEATRLARYYAPRSVPNAEEGRRVLQAIGRRPGPRLIARRRHATATPSRDAAQRRPRERGVAHQDPRTPGLRRREPATAGRRRAPMEACPPPPRVFDAPDRGRTRADRGPVGDAASIPGPGK